jgi:hypothetical protein
MKVFVYHLQPDSREQFTALYELCSDYAYLCDDIARVFKGLRDKNGGEWQDRETFNKEVYKMSVFKEPVHEDEPDSPRRIPSRYLALAMTRVYADLPSEPQKQYSSRDWVNLDGDVCTHKCNKLFKMPSNELTIKMFGTGAGVREPFAITDITESTTGEYDYLNLNASQAALVHRDAQLWRVVVGVPEDTKK